jgi:Antitoxin VbhA
MEYKPTYEHTKEGRLKTVEDRRQAHIEATANSELEGYKLSDEDEAIFQKWITGEYTEADLIRIFFDECGISYD